MSVMVLSMTVWFWVGRVEERDLLTELTWTSSLVPHHNVNFTGHFSPEQIGTQAPCQSRSDDQDPGHFSTETQPQIEPNGTTNGPLRTVRTVKKDVCPKTAGLWWPKKTIPETRRNATQPVEPFTVNLAKPTQLVWLWASCLSVC